MHVDEDHLASLVQRISLENKHPAQRLPSRPARPARPPRRQGRRRGLRAPDTLRTLLVWALIGVAMPLLGNAPRPLAFVILASCALRYAAACRLAFAVLLRCIRRDNSARTRNRPRASVVAWEAWAPAPIRRALLAFFAIALVTAAADVVVRLAIDIAVDAVASLHDSATTAATASAQDFRLAAPMV